MLCEIGGLHSGFVEDLGLHDLEDEVTVYLQTRRNIPEDLNIQQNIC
jgi:hypothetical protein